MTYDGGKPHAVGDRGQRFEVSVYDEDKGERIVCGWTDNADDASKMAASFALRPGWSLEQVRDRKPIGAEQPLVKLRIKLTKAEKEIARLTEQAATDKDFIEQYQRQVESLTTDLKYYTETYDKQKEANESLLTEVSELTEQIRQKDAQAKGFVQLYDVVSTYRIAPVVVDDPNVMAWCDQIEDALEMIEYPDGTETADGGMGLADAVAQFRMDRNIESEKILLDLTEKLLWYADEKGGIFAPQIRSLVKDASTVSGSPKPCEHQWKVIDAMVGSVCIPDMTVWQCTKCLAQAKTESRFEGEPDAPFTKTYHLTKPYNADIVDGSPKQCANLHRCECVAIEGSEYCYVCDQEAKDVAALTADGRES